jgi:ethanolamine utilization protein EutN
MILARVDGHTTASIAHRSLKGQKIVFCSPVDETGAVCGAPIAAIDPIGAGIHSHVIISTDGSWTQECLGDSKSPVRNQVIGIIDPLRA